MRTLDLIKALSDSEIKEVEKLLSGGKREILLKVFKELKKYATKTDEPSHEELFEKLMKEPYAKDKDYLLRNRMRQLNEILYEYLATDAFKHTCERNPDVFNLWLTKAYYDRKMKPLFENEIDGALESAVSHISARSGDFGVDSLLLYALKSLWMINNEPRIPENIEKQIVFADQWMEELKRRFLYKIREIEARKAFLQMMHKMTRNEPKADIPTDGGLATMDLRQIEEGDWYARYLLLKKQVYQTHDREMIKVLEEMLSISAVEEYGAILGLNDRITNMTNLATEYIMTGEYRKADDTLANLLDVCKHANHPAPIGAVQNHLVNQINLGEYENGLKLFKLYQKEILSSRSVNAIVLQKCYLHLFLHHEEEALSHLPDSLSMTKQHQIHHRYVYLITFILRGDIDLALSEANNLKRLIKRTTDIDTKDQEEIIDYFEKYIKSLMQKKVIRNKSTNSLKLKIEARYETLDPIASKELPLRWLMVHLKITKAGSQ